MTKSQAVPKPAGQLSKEDLQILKLIEHPEAVPLTEAEKEDLIVNQILLRRLMRALRTEPAAQPQPQATAPAQTTRLPRPMQPPIQPAQTQSQPLEKAA